MKCFQHVTADAVGLCVACGRGLCPACARQTAEDHIVCSDDCERTALQVSALRNAQARRFAINAATMRGTAIVCRLLGMACTLAGLFNLFLTFVLPTFGAFRGAMKPIPAVGFGVLMFLFSAIFVGAARIARVLETRYSDVVREFDDPTLR